MHKPLPNAPQMIQGEDLFSKKDLENVATLMETYKDEVVLQEGKILHMAKRTVALPNGKLATREIAYHNGAAAVVPVDSEGNVYLVYQHRCILNTVTLEIPAGKMDENESDPLACAVRELSEETGLCAKNMTWLSNMLSSPGFCTEFVSIYLATDLVQEKAHTDADEFLGVLKLPLKEAVKRVMCGELNDAKTAMGILMAAKVLGVE